MATALKDLVLYLMHHGARSIEARIEGGDGSFALEIRAEVEMAEERRIEEDIATLLKFKDHPEFTYYTPLTETSEDADALYALAPSVKSLVHSYDGRVLRIRIVLDHHHR